MTNKDKKLIKAGLVFFQFFIVYSTCFKHITFKFSYSRNILDFSGFSDINGLLFFENFTKTSLSGMQIFIVNF